MVVSSVHSILCLRSLVSSILFHGACCQEAEDESDVLAGDSLVPPWAMPYCNCHNKRLYTRM